MTQLVLDVTRCRYIKYLRISIEIMLGKVWMAPENVVFPLIDLLGRMI